MFVVFARYSVSGRSIHTTALQRGAQNLWVGVNLIQKANWPISPTRLLKCFVKHKADYSISIH